MVRTETVETGNFVSVSAARRSTVQECKYIITPEASFRVKEYMHDPIRSSPGTLDSLAIHKYPWYTVRSRL